MPPKKADKKAPAGQTDEDLSDLSSLPHLNLFTFSTMYYFYFQKSKDEVKESIDLMLTEEQLANNEELKHIKSITRLSIIELIKGKLILSLPTFLNSNQF